MTVNQEEVVSFDYHPECILKSTNSHSFFYRTTQKAVVTASKSRKKHQQEILHKALQTEEQSKRIARENFTLTNLPFLQCASFEPLLHQNREEDEGWFA